MRTFASLVLAVCASCRHGPVVSPPRASDNELVKTVVSTHYDLWEVSSEETSFVLVYILDVATCSTRGGAVTVVRRPSEREHQPVPRNGLKLLWSEGGVAVAEARDVRGRLSEGGGVAVLLWLDHPKSPTGRAEGSSWLLVFSDESRIRVKSRRRLAKLRSRCFTEDGRPLFPVGLRPRGSGN